MKCPYCGGEVSVNDVRCPYCGNLNPEGAAFQGEVRRRRKLNEYLRQKMRDQLWLPLAQRIMNLAIVILALLWILVTVLGMIWYLVRDPRTLGLGRPTIMNPSWKPSMMKAAMANCTHIWTVTAWMDRIIPSTCRWRCITTLIQTSFSTA